MLDFFLCQNIAWRYRRGRKKNSVQQFLAPPSEWRPRRLPIPPVGKTATAWWHPCTAHVASWGIIDEHEEGGLRLGSVFYATSLLVLQHTPQGIVLSPF